MNNQSRIDSILLMLQEEPGDVFLNYALGLEYLKLEEKITEAILQFEKVIAINHHHIASYYQLGQAFQAQGKNEIALNYFNKGLEIAKTLKDNKAVNEFSEAIFLLED